MLLTANVFLPSVNQQEKNPSREQSSVINLAPEHVLPRIIDEMLLCPPGNTRTGNFDVKVSGILKNKYQLLPRMVDNPDSYLMLKVLNNAVFRKDMMHSEVILPEDIEMITQGHFENSSMNSLPRNKSMATLFLLRLRNFGEFTQENKVIWLKFSTDLLNRDKTSVVIELIPIFGTDSKSQCYCHWKIEFNYLDPTSSYNKTCKDPLAALEYAKLNPYPASNDSKMELALKKKGKYV
jgi:hypothetical protein